MTRRKFSCAFKIEAVRLVTDRDVAVAQATRYPDVAGTVFRRWMRERTALPALAPRRNWLVRAALAESVALKKEVARLRAERDILKKGEPWSATGSSTMASTFFRARGDMRFALIANHRRLWRVSRLCDVPEVSRSGFHSWLTCPNRIREIEHAQPVTGIGTSFKANDRSCGDRRVWREGLEGGVPAGFTGSNC